MLKPYEARQVALFRRATLRHFIPRGAYEQHDLWPNFALLRKAAEYSGDLAAKGIIENDRCSEMTVWLAWAAIYQKLGNLRYSEARLAFEEQKVLMQDLRDYARANDDIELKRLLHRAASSFLPRKGRSIQAGDRWAIMVISSAWEYFGLRPSTATHWDDPEYRGSFEKAVNGWIKVIDPDRQHDLPGRNVFRRSISGYRRLLTEKHASIFKKHRD